MQWPRLQFGLKTLLLVTTAAVACAAWIGSVVRERRAVHAYAMNHGVWTDAAPHSNAFRRMIGDVSATHFVIGSGYEFNGEEDRLRSAFPEAEVTWFEPPETPLTKDE